MKLLKFSPRMMKIHKFAVAAHTKWRESARPDQMTPEGDWTRWICLAGRGWGKSRVLSEWAWWESWINPGTYTHIIAPTWDSDVIGVCFEGQSGIIKSTPPECIESWNKSEAILKLVNGSVIRGFSAEKPARLRGPQCHRLGADELAAWMYLEDTWDMAMMGLRLGKNVQTVVTTTPRPLPKIVEFIKESKDPKSGTIVSSGTTYDNQSNLSPKFFSDIINTSEGTTLGRQEIYAEVIDPEEMGVIKRSWWKLWPAEKALPAFSYVILSVDTAYSEHDRDKKTGETDYSACSVWGLFDDPDHPRREALMLLDAWQDKLGFPELLERIKREKEVAYGERTQPLIKPVWGKPLIGLGGGHKPDLILIEEKAAGMSLIQSLANEQIFAQGYNPGRESKLMRLHSVSHLFARGMIYVPESHKNRGRPMGFAEDAKQPGIISQICTYSGEGSTKHDDYVDTATQAIRYLTDRNLITITPPPPRDIEAEEAARERKKVNPYKV